MKKFLVSIIPSASTQGRLRCPRLIALWSA